MCDRNMRQGTAFLAGFLHLLPTSSGQTSRDTIGSQALDLRRHCQFDEAALSATRKLLQRGSLFQKFLR